MGWLEGKSLLPTWLALIGAATAAADQASACSCAFSPTASVIERADVAFEGEVVDVDPEAPCADPDQRGQRPLWCHKAWRLRVLTPLKGQPGNVVTLYSGLPCGYPFTKGERLKVVAWYTPDRRLRTGMCAMFSANRKEMGIPEMLHSAVPP